MRIEAADGSSPTIDLVVTVGDPPSGVRRLSGGALALERSELVSGTRFAGPFRPGTRSFLSVVEAGSGTYAIELVDLDDPIRRTTLARGVPSVRWPTFSPDGRWLIFGGVVGGEGAIMKVNAEGGAVEVLAASPDGVFDPSVTHDGQQVVFAASSRSGLGLSRVPLAGGTPRPLGTGRIRPYGTPRASPREDLVAFVGFEAPGRLRVFAVRPRAAADARIRALSPLPGTRGTMEHLVFARDGERVAYVVAEGPAPRVEVVEVDSGRLLLRTPAGQSAQHPAFSPNGSLLAITAAGPSGPAVTILSVSDAAVLTTEPGVWLAQFVPPAASR